MQIKTFAGAAALLFATLGPAAHAANLVVNGDFETTTYTQNNQFGSGLNPYQGGQLVNKWVGNSGYNLYFFAGTATTTSANSQYGGNSEKLYGKLLPNNTYAPIVSPTGGNFVALDGDQGNAQNGNVQGAISQDITGLTIGAKYLLTFSWGAGQLQSRTGDTTEQLQASLCPTLSGCVGGNDTQLTEVLSDPSKSFSGWVTETFTYTATATAETLRFLSIGTPSGLPPIATLDGVSLTQVPEPAALGLLGVGLVGLIAVRRRA